MKIVLNPAAGNTPRLPRSAVKSGQVFKLVKKDGSFGSQSYVAIGHNGRSFSMNVATGALASTDNMDKTVTLTGKAVLKTAYQAAVATTRGKVKSGDIFRVKGKNVSYVALGTLRDGKLASLNMANPFDENYAVTSNLNSHVEVVGSAALHIGAVRD